MKLLIKIVLNTAGIIITLSVLYAAFTVAAERADAKYDDGGAYDSALLAWKQEKCGEGTLTVFGKPLKLDLDGIRQFVSRAEASAERLSEMLPESVRSAAASLWSALCGASESIVRAVF